MGTRHLIIVKDKTGTTKISQYGQWDGYPSGQGRNILAFLKQMNYPEFDKQLRKLREVTQTEVDEIDKLGEEWPEKYPYLSRDCGSKILQMTQDGKVKFVSICTQKEADRWCEGFYTIDLKKRKFYSEFHNIKKMYSLDKLPTEEKYLSDMKDNK